MTPGNVLSATASGSTVAGSYAIKVSQLATAQSLTSKPLASQSAAIAVAASVTLKFDFGTTVGATARRWRVVKPSRFTVTIIRCRGLLQRSMKRDWRQGDGHFQRSRLCADFDFTDWRG